MALYQQKKNTGYVLLVFLLVLMGLGGVALAGISQQLLESSEEKRFEHNKKILQQAKDALLMYAYRYPSIAGRGPGRLPCPDTDNTGTPNATPNCLNAGVAQVGRFPWDANGMDFFDANDSSGERLWYAVSSAFDNGPATILNSDTAGTITVFDQTGAMLYDGVASGIAAVIIAPGTAINGQDRSIANLDNPFDQVADTDPGIINPANYLDSFGAFDNSAFVNSANAAADGFILGPVFDPVQNIITVNDQMVIVTTEEVIAMAEKATLDAYKTAIQEYQQNIWGANVANYRYPWLDDYSTTDLTEFDGDINTLSGRVPSIFANYFSANDSQPIISEINMLLDIDSHPVSVTVPASVNPDVFFKADGNLSVSFNSGATFTGYVWDGHPTNLPTLPEDGIWEACPYVTGTEEDCNQDVAGNFIGGTTSDVWLKVRQVTFSFNGLSPFEFLFGNLTAAPLVYSQPNAVNHAFVTAEYGYTGIGYVSAVTWSQDDTFQVGFAETPVGNNGNLTFNGGDTIRIGLRYYPQIPNWSLTNDWHNSIQAVVAADYTPIGAGDCITNAPCLTLNNQGGVNNNKGALLVLAGQHNLVDELADGFTNDLLDIFEPENDDSNNTYDKRAGNDTVLVLREQ